MKSSGKKNIINWVVFLKGATVISPKTIELTIGTSQRIRGNSSYPSLQPQSRLIPILTTSKLKYWYQNSKKRSKWAISCNASLSRVHGIWQQTIYIQIRIQKFLSLLWGIQIYTQVNILSFKMKIKITLQLIYFSSRKMEKYMDTKPKVELKHWHKKTTKTFITFLNASIIYRKKYRKKARMPKP